MLNFDTIVVGKGLLGSAAARHLACGGVRTALIGPDEPVNKSSHTGVFASHYDEGRITRGLDPDADWSRLAVQSMCDMMKLREKVRLSFSHGVGHYLPGRDNT